MRNAYISIEAKRELTNKYLLIMDTFKTDGKRGDKKSSFDIKVESIKERLQQFIDEGKSKYQIAMELPELLKSKEGIEENLTRYYIREKFEQQS